jgi:cytoplasmic iron level regulating protein YaaA (DUF328/UPF0246 family)
MARPLPLILLPPSEGKARGGDGPPWAPGTMALDLDASRERVLTALLRAMKGGEAARAALLEVKGRALASATEADRSVRTSATVPAIERYTGVLYDALDHASLPAASKRRLATCVLIASGLWGAVAPTDPIPDYKLKMGAALPGLGKLSTWWREPLSAEIAGRAAGRRIWNLLPLEHAAAWRAPGGVEQLSARFLDRRPDGSLAVVSHANKRLKGELVRYLLAHPDADERSPAGWDQPSGYRLDPASTQEREGVTTVAFVREP